MLANNNNRNNNSFRQGLPKMNRFVASPKFRQVGSPNGRHWSQSPRADSSRSKVAEYLPKPRVADIKHHDKALRHALFLAKLQKQAKGPMRMKDRDRKNRRRMVKSVPERFLTFSPFDSRFPKFFDSYSPFDARFEEFAKDKIYQSFSPFDSRFPNYPYKKYGTKKNNGKRGFLSFSPFDTRFPKFFESFSPFDSRFPVGGTSKPFPTYSPFDAKFPSHFSTVKKMVVPAVTKSISKPQVKLGKAATLRKQLLLKLFTIHKSPSQGSLSPRSAATKKASIVSKSSSATTPKNASKSVPQSPKATVLGTPKRSGASIIYSYDQKPLPSPKQQSTISLAAAATQPIATAPVPQKSQTTQPVFLPRSSMGPMPDAFPRFSPMARTFAAVVMGSPRVPQMAPLPVNFNARGGYAGYTTSPRTSSAPSPLSQVLKNGGFTNMPNGRFAM